MLRDPKEHSAETHAHYETNRALWRTCGKTLQGNKHLRRFSKQFAETQNILRISRNTPWWSWSCSKHLQHVSDGSDMHKPQKHADRKLKKRLRSSPGILCGDIQTMQSKQEYVSRITEKHWDDPECASIHSQLRDFRNTLWVSRKALQIVREHVWDTDGTLCWNTPNMPWRLAEKLYEDP